MTNENIIEIKKQQKNWLIKGFIFLFLMLASLFLALLPLVNELAKTNSKLFYSVGFSLFAVFTVLYSINLYKACKPANALILSARGFIDRLNVGDDIEIEWTNVTAVRMLGRANMPFLGVTLENPDMILDKMKKGAAAEMRENIEQNLPTLLIPQNKVMIKIKDLKDTFAKFAREARALEKDSQQKTKSNPFTTDDVLRAFGKLPKDEEASEPEQLVSNNDTSAKNVEETRVFCDNGEENGDTLKSEHNNNEEYDAFDINQTVAIIDVNDEELEAIEENETNEIIDEVEEDNEIDNDVKTYDIETQNEDINIVIEESTSEPQTNDDDVKTVSPFEIPEDISNVDKQGETKISASDSFYAALRAKATTKAESSQQNYDVPNININNAFDSAEEKSTSDVEMTDEIQEILSRAKSSRITEIEKILSDTDIPFSLSRKDIPTEENPIDNSSQFEESALADESSDFDTMGIDNALNNAIETEEPVKEETPSLSGVFDEDDNESDEEIKFDLSFITDDDNKEDDTDLIGASLESLLGDALKPNGETASANNTNLGDTREFITD